MSPGARRLAPAFRGTRRAPVRSFGEVRASGVELTEHPPTVVVLSEEPRDAAGGPREQRPDPGHRQSHHRGPVDRHPGALEAERAARRVRVVEHRQGARRHLGEVVPGAPGVVVVAAVVPAVVVGGRGRPSGPRGRPSLVAAGVGVGATAETVGSLRRRESARGPIRADRGRCAVVGCGGASACPAPMSLMKEALGNHPSSCGVGDPTKATQ